MTSSSSSQYGGRLSSPQLSGREQAVSPLLKPQEEGRPMTAQDYENSQAVYMEWKASLIHGSKHANLSRIPKPSLLRRAASVKSQKGVASATYVSAHNGVGPLGLFAKSPRLDDPL